MKFPICRVCLKNDILCNGCTEEVKELKIKDSEIKTFRELNKLLKSFSSLKDVEIKRVINNKEMLLIITRQEDMSKLIGKNGGMVRKLGKDLNKQIRVVGDSSTLEEFVKEILFSTPILGINIVYSEEGKRYRIRIPSSERVLLPISPEVFSKVTNNVLKVDAELIFD